MKPEEPLPFGKDVKGTASSPPPPAAAPTVALTKAPAAQPGTPAFFKAELGKKMSALENFFDTKKEGLRFLSSVMKCIEATPELLTCDSKSLLGAFMECAGLGLFPEKHSGDCYVLPYAGKAQFQLGYRGLKTLAFRSGILKCGTEIVYKKDKYKETRGTNPQIIHEPVLDGDRGAAYRVYAWAEVTPGHIVFKSMSKDEVMKIKAISRAKDSKYSPWNVNDPELWMWQKTAFKQLAKLLPTSDRLSRGIYLDNVSERGGYIEAEGKVHEESFGDDNEAKMSVADAKKDALRKKKAGAITTESHE